MIGRLADWYIDIRWAKVPVILSSATVFLLAFWTLVFVPVQPAKTHGIPLEVDPMHQANPPAQPDETQESSSGWQMVGQVGGRTEDVAVQGDYAYVAVGLRLAVLDVSQPITPTEIGSTTPFPQFVTDVAVSGTVVYVADGTAGLRIVDISDPVNPVEVGAYDTPGYAEGVTMASQYAYIADGHYGLRIVDISNPTHPTEVAYAYPLNYVFDVVVDGHIAYLAAAGAGLLVVNVSDPAHPTEIGAYDTPGYAYGVDVAEDVIYIADGWEGLRLADISDPVHPIEVGSLDTPGWALSVDVRGSAAYVANGGNGLRIVDVSDSEHPCEMGAYEIPGTAVMVAVQGDVAYMVDRRAGLRAIDISDAQSPTQVGIYAPLADARRLAVQGQYAYVAAGYSGLRIVDVSDPAYPKEAGVYDTEGGYACSVVVTDSYAYLATFMGGLWNLHVVDIADSTHPTRTGVIHTDGAYREIAVAGDTVYVADEWGLRLIDVCSPTVPAEIGFIELIQDYAATQGIAVSGTLAYLAAADAGVLLVDVSNPADMSVVGTYDSPGNVQGVAVAGSRMYVADSDGLRVADVSSPTLPVEMGFFDTPGVVESVTTSGTLAYVSDGGGGLHVVEVSNPTDPTLAGGYDTPGFAWYTAATDEYTYVADGSGGLLILEMNPDFGTVHSQPMGSPGIPDSSDEVVSLPLARFAVSRASRGLGLPSSATVQQISRSAERQPEKHHDETFPIPFPDNSLRLPGSAVPHTSASTCAVTNPADSGPGTLRWCVENAVSGDTITFDSSVFSPTNPVTIALTSELPPITQGNLTVDASDAGVILDGTNLPEGSDGLRISSSDNTIKGLQILHFDRYGIAVSDNASYNIIGGNRTIGAGPSGQGNVLSANGFDGLRIDGSDNTVLGNLIGTDATGSADLGNVVCGVEEGGQRNFIGGATAGERNIISANQVGVYLASVNSTVAGNYIGTDASGELALGNQAAGIAIYGGTCNRVGGTTPEERNLISGNHWGVIVSDPHTIHNVIIGNLIGTNATGTAPLGNHGGVLIWTSGFNRVGGTTGEERNIISGNTGPGISLGGLEMSDNIVLGNYIGTDISGSQALGNGTGVSINEGMRHNFVGGTTYGERNVISGNGTGVQIAQAGIEHNQISGNYIGTDISGALALGNEWGFWVTDGAAHNVIQDNLISGNDWSGVSMATGSTANILRANRIGIAADGASPLPNGMGGVRIEAVSNTVGGPYPEDGNIIAFNAGVGVEVCTYSGNTIRRNAIHNNIGPGIVLTDGGNNALPAPIITGIHTGSVSGTACPGCVVEIFSDEEDEGQVYEGYVIADGSGNWIWTGSPSGPHVTATATDEAGNTSAFSAPTIIDEELTVQFSSNTYSVSEGAGTASITVTLNTTSTWQTVTVNYATGDSKATDSGNHTTASGILTFAPGEISQTFTLTVTDDVLDEPDEIVTLTLSSPTIATLGTPHTATLTIMDDDVPTVQFDPASYSIGEEDGEATITATLNITSWQMVSVTYATSNGTATAGNDYTAISGTLTFVPSVTSTTFVVTIGDDALDEDDETVLLILSNAINATITGTNPVTLTIADNDIPTVQFSSSTYSVSEGDDTTMITATLNITSWQTVSVTYATSNGTATAGDDYTATSGTLTFAPGQTNQTFSVAVIDDEFYELDETVTLRLSNPVNADLGTLNSSTLTILDDDPTHIFLPIALSNYPSLTRHGTRRPFR